MGKPSKGGGAIRGPQDIAGGVLLILIAAFALYLVNHLPAYTRIGFASGTAPRIFAYGLGGLGALIVLEGFLKAGPALGTLPWRGPLTIIGSVLLFALAIRTFGLALTGVPMVMLASYASEEMRWKESLAFAMAITFFCALLFPIALSQPIPLWPTLKL